MLYSSASDNCIVPTRFKPDGTDVSVKNPSLLSSSHSKFSSTNLRSYCGLALAIVPVAYSVIA